MWEWRWVATVKNEGGTRYKDNIWMYLTACPICHAVLDEQGQEPHEAWHTARGEEPVPTETFSNAD